MVGRKRRKRKKSVSMKKSKVVSLVKEGAGVALGAAISDMITRKVPLVKDNPAMGGIASVVLAVVLGDSKEVKSIKIGLASRGVVTIAKSVAPDLTNKLGIGLTSQMMSHQTPGVAYKKSKRLQA